jgi:DNA-binding NarL/FixJ family response regulator
MSIHRDPVRALLADDHAVFRSGLRRVLAAKGISVIGEASNGRDAVRLTAELRPDVVVMDTHMPIMTGVEATRLICSRSGAPVVVVLADAATDDVLDAILAGAQGCLSRDADANTLAAGIEQAAAGNATLTSVIADAVVKRLRYLETERRKIERRKTVDYLTQRERQVLTLVANGRDNVAIGKELFISSSTVKHHVAAILEKLGASNRAQAAAEAVRIGLV